MGCIKGQIDVLIVRTRDFAQHLTRDWGRILKILTIYRRNPLPVDVVTVASFEWVIDGDVVDGNAHAGLLSTLVGEGLFHT
jgi:hypothetical protein